MTYPTDATPDHTSNPVAGAGFTGQHVTEHSGTGIGHDDHDSKLTGGPANQDPITGEPGSHPIGTGLGTAAGGAAAGALGGAVAGPVGSVVGAVVGGIAGGLAGKGAGEAVNHTDETAAARAEAERHQS